MNPPPPFTPHPPPPQKKKKKEKKKKILIYQNISERTSKAPKTKTAYIFPKKVLNNFF